MSERDINSGFYVWFKGYVFFFEDNYPHAGKLGPVYWGKRWAEIHGPGVYIPLTEDGWTPSLFEDFGSDAPAGGLL